MHPDVVLDASAVLALLHGEPGGDEVARHIPRARISAVNLAEVVAKLVEAGMPGDAVRLALAHLDLVVVPLDEVSAHLAGSLRPATRHRGLSLGDRACLALGATLRCPVLTTDRAWLDLDVGVEVRVVR